MKIEDTYVADMFRVDPQRIGTLDPYAAVDLAGRLIRADASASGIPANVVDIPSNIAAPDGGVDGTATDSPRQSVHGLVKKGMTAYQFRTGAFVPSSSIAGILFTRQGEIKPRIRSCIEGGGTLVVMLFGWDGAARTADDALAERFKRALAAKSGALAGAKVDVWGLNRIATVIERFPGLATGASSGIPADTPAMSHYEWSRVLDMTPPFRHGKAEDGVVERIRARLRRGGDAPVLARVSGPPGSGKTRLVLEATRADDLAPRVVYTAKPSIAESIISARARRIGGAGSGRLIIIVDECDLVHQFNLWRRLSVDKEGVADLVTIYNEPGVDKEMTLQVEVPGMGDEQITEILEDYAEGMIDNIGTWVKRCRSSPRAAHIVGQNLSAGPGKLYRDPDDAMVWERYIAGQEELGGGEYKDRLAVLLWLSQFTRFGFDAPYERDGARIADLVHRHHPGIPAYRFREVVRTLRSMRVLQGGPILYITPGILHEYLWLKWWERYGQGDMPQLPPGDDGGEGDGADARGEGEAGHLQTLHSRYYRMMESMRRNKDTASALGALFGKGGPLEEGSASGDGLDSYLFMAASEASPAAAIGYAEAAVAVMQRQDRGDVPMMQWHAAVAAGRCMLGERETFVRAARLLLALADPDADGGEGDAFAADACRTFCDALDPAPAMGLPGIPLAERLDVLSGAVRRGAGEGSGAQDCERARRVGLRACGTVLAMRHFSPEVPHRHRISDNVAYWRPENRDELAAYLRGVLELAVEAGLDSGGSEAVRKEAAGAVFGSLAQTALLPEVAERSVEAAERMREAGLIDGEMLVAAAEGLAMHESHRIVPAAMRRIDAIVDRGAAAAAREGLHERLARRIGVDGYKRRLRFDTAGSDRDAIGLLADELARDAAALDAELEWLVGEEADGRCVALLGYELAARDCGEGGDADADADAMPPPPLLLGRIEDATRQEGLEGGGGHLLAGYLVGMGKKRPRMAEATLERILEEGDLRCILPMAARMSGEVSERLARRMAQAVVDGRLERRELATTVRGRTLDGISDEAFCIVAGALASGGAAAASPAPPAYSEEGGTDGNSRGGDDTVGSAMLSMVRTRYVDRRGGGSDVAGRPGRMLTETITGMLLHEDVLGGRPGAGLRYVDVEMWVTAALALARREGDEETASRLAEGVLGRLGVRGIFETDAAVVSAAPLLDEIARAHPRAAWRIAASFMGPPLDKRACYVRAWLAGRPGGQRPRARADEAGGIAALPAQVVLEWAAEDPRARPQRIADLLSPPSLGMARDLVARFGGLDGVAEGAAHGFKSWRVWGPAESDMQDALARLGAMRRGEDDPRAAAWLDERIGELVAEVDRRRGRAARPERAAPLLSG